MDDVGGDEVLTGIFWVVRAAAFVGIAATTPSGRSDHPALVITGLVVSGVLLAGWATVDAAPRFGWLPPGWSRLALLVAVVVVGGLGGGLGGGRSLVWFSIIGVVGAGSDLDAGPACAIGAGAVLAIEVGSFADHTSVEENVVLPLLVVVGLLLGRSRREVSIRRAQAAALVEQAERTEAEQRRAATLDERNRVAREIHDLLAHSLGALGVQLGAIHAVLTDTGDIERAAGLVDEARRMARTGLEETREAIQALRSDTPPLPETLAVLAESHERQHHASVQLQVSGAPRPVPPDATVALVRTVGEALANSAKHAVARPIFVTLEYGPDQLTMTVCNGVPDGPAEHQPSHAGPSGGYGLAGMRERLLLLGGSLTAGPSDTGWTVQARLPA